MPVSSKLVGADQVVKTLERAQKAAKQSTVDATNVTAKKAMGMIGREGEGQGKEALASIRVTRATLNRTQSRISSKGGKGKGPGKWLSTNINMPFSPKGGAKTTLSGEYVAVSAQKQMARVGLLKQAVKRGFASQMKSGKIGLFMRKGTARLPIYRAFGLYTKEFADDLQSKGHRFIRQRYSIYFARIFDRRLKR